MKKYIVSLLLFAGLQAGAQTNSRAEFKSPFDFPLLLSGSFGELRANHFHAGLDFKTQGATGKKVLAVADGYISRVQVLHGSGYVLHVTYNNGYTSTQRHDQALTGKLAQRIENLQYEKESWEVDFTPEPHEYPVKAGQHISLSGNMGYSFGPHLHFELRETESGDYVDPLPYFKRHIKDTRPPQVLGYVLFPQTGRGVVNGQTTPRIFGTTAKDTLQAWGVIGAGIRAYDYMTDTNNRYGVHTVILEVDGQEVFRSEVDRFSSHEDRMINSWTYKGRYMKSYKEPGNTLRMLKPANNNRGLVTIDQERDYHFQYTLKDVHGNTTRCGFVVKGRRAPIAAAPPRNKYYFAWNDLTFFYESGLGIVIPKGMLYDDVYLDFAASEAPTAIAPTYRLTKEPVPLHAYCDLRIAIKNNMLPDSTKYYIARVGTDGKLTSLGGRYDNGIMRARVRELGTFTIAADTVPPRVTPVQKANWGKRGQVIFKVGDEETGIRSYRGTIDGKYVPFGLRIMSNRLVYDLDARRVKRGKTHEVVLTVTDNRGNETIVKETFKY